MAWTAATALTRRRTSVRTGERPREKLSADREDTCNVPREPLRLYTVRRETSTMIDAMERERMLEHGRLADLYVRHAQEGIRLAFLLTGDWALAEDLVQDAFARL